MANRVRRTMKTARSHVGVVIALVITGAAAVGLNSAVLELVRAVWLDAVPYEHPDRLAILFVDRGPDLFSQPTSNEFEAWRISGDVFQSIAALSRNEIASLGVGDREIVIGSRRVQSAFFAQLPERPLLGRLLNDSDREDDAVESIVITERVWRSHFGASLAAIGRQATLNGRPVAVVGVVSDRVRRIQGSEVFRALNLGTGRPTFGLTVLARLKATQSAQTAMDWINGLNRGDAARIQIRNLREYIVGASSPRTLVILGGAGACVFGVASLNLANLWLTVAFKRRQEWATRIALGASFQSLSIDWIVEVLLVLAGIVFVGAAFSWALIKILQSSLSLSSVGEISIFSSFALATMTAIVLGCISGLLPIWKLRQFEKKDGVLSILRHDSSADTAAAATVLLAAQIALTSLIILIAGTLGRSYGRLVSVDLGFEPAGLVIVRGTTQAGLRFMGPQTVDAEHVAIDAFRSMPTVVAAGSSDQIPFGRVTATYTVRNAIDDVAGRVIAYRRVSHGYFEAIGARLVAGRFFEQSDMASGAPIAVVNETAARVLWPSSSPIGKTVYAGAPIPLQVVGVVSDMRGTALDREPEPELFRPRRQDSNGEAVFAIRTQRPGEFIQALRENNGLPFAVTETSTLDDLIAESVQQPRTRLALFAGFSILMIGLALFGVYSLTNRVLSLKTREVGIRMSLGAMPKDVVGLTVKITLLPVLCGVASGLVLWNWASVVVKDVLFETGTNEVAVVVGSSLGFLAVSVVTAGFGAIQFVRCVRITSLRLNDASM